MGGGGGGTRTESEASGQFAEIARDVWKDYKRRFIPKENQLISMVSAPQQEYKKAMDFVNTGVNTAFNTQQGTNARDIARMGVSLTPEQQQTMARTNSLSQTSTMAGAENAARQQIKDRNMAIMGGGLTTTYKTLDRGK